MAGATYIAAKNTDLTGQNVISDLKLRLRVELKVTVATATTPSFKYQYKKNAGAWTDITAASSDVRTSLSSNFADGDDCAVALLTAATLITNNNAAEESTGTFTMPVDFTLGQAIESEISLVLRSADLSHGDTLDFRVVLSDATILDTYTQTPSIAAVVQKNIAAGTATVAWTTNAATIKRTRNLTGALATVAWSPIASTVAKVRAVVAIVAELVWTKNTQGVNLTRNVAGIVDSIAWTGNSATLVKTLEVAATTVTLSWTEQVATANKSRVITQVSIDALVWTANQATINTGKGIAAATVALVWTVNTDRDVAANTASVSWSGVSSTINRERGVDQIPLVFDDSGKEWLNVTDQLAGSNYRTHLLASQLTGDATSLRIVLHGHTTEISEITNVAFGEKTGNWDFVASPAPVSVKFAGLDAVTIPAGGTVTSDVFSFVLDSSKGMQVSFYMSDANWDGARQAVVGGAGDYFNESAVDESQDLSPISYSRANHLFIEKVERVNADGSTSLLWTENAASFIPQRTVTQLSPVLLVWAESPASVGGDRAFTTNVVAVSWTGNQASLNRTRGLSTTIEVLVWTANAAQLPLEVVQTSTVALVWTENAVTVGGVRDVNQPSTVAVVWTANAAALAAGATWKAAKNANLTNLNVASDVNLRLRVEILNSISAETPASFKFQYNKNSTGWNDITASSSNIKTFDTTWYADGDDCLEALLTSGTLITDNNAAEDSTGTFTVPSFTLGDVVETEVALTFVSADLAEADSIDFRVVKSNGIVLSAYTQTPTVGTSKAGSRNVEQSAPTTMVWTEIGASVAPGSGRNVEQGSTTTVSWTANVSVINATRNVQATYLLDDWTPLQATVERGTERFVVGVAVALVWTENQAVLEGPRLVEQVNPALLVWAENTATANKARKVTQVAIDAIVWTSLTATTTRGHDVTQADPRELKWLRDFVIDPEFIVGCVTSGGDGWQCNNGATIVGGEAILDNEAATEHVLTRLWDDPINPRGPNITLRFHVRQLSSGTGVRLRTTGNNLQGQYTEGDQEVTYAAVSAPETIQFEIISGFGTWAISSVSTVIPASINGSRNITTITASLAWTANKASTTPERDVEAKTATLSWTAIQASISAGLNVAAKTAAVVWTAIASTIVKNLFRAVTQVATDALSWTANSSTVVRARTIVAQVATAIWTENRADVTRGAEIVQLNPVQLVWTGSTASITTGRASSQQAALSLVWSAPDATIKKKFFWQEENPEEGSWTKDGSLGGGWTEESSTSNTWIEEEAA